MRISECLYIKKEKKKKYRHIMYTKIPFSVGHVSLGSNTAQYIHFVDECEDKTINLEWTSVILFFIN